MEAVVCKWSLMFLEREKLDTKRTAATSNANDNEAKRRKGEDGKVMATGRCRCILQYLRCRWCGRGGGIIGWCAYTGVVRVLPLHQQHLRLACSAICSTQDDRKHRGYQIEANTHSISQSRHLSMHYSAGKRTFNLAVSAFRQGLLIGFRCDPPIDCAAYEENMIDASSWENQIRKVPDGLLSLDQRREAA
nr:hypothetical protein CFP56_68136 [Quercus suber]